MLKSNGKCRRMDVVVIFVTPMDWLRYAEKVKSSRLVIYYPQSVPDAAVWSCLQASKIQVYATT